MTEMVTLVHTFNRKCHSFGLSLCISLLSTSPPPQPFLCFYCCNMAGGSAARVLPPTGYEVNVWICLRRKSSSKDLYRNKEFLRFNVVYKMVVDCRYVKQRTTYENTDSCDVAKHCDSFIF